MAENGERSPVIAVQYDAQADILTFAFTESPQPGVAEEAADEVWVRWFAFAHQGGGYLTLCQWKPNPQPEDIP